MLRRMVYQGAWILTTAVVLVASTGCTGGGAALPAETELELPDGTTMSVEQGSGAASLADTVWEFRNEAGVAFVTIRFGPNGEFTTFENNTIAQDFLGTTVLLDGARHATDIPLLQYAAATYGAETSDATGFTFLSELGVYVPIVGEIASGEATATGELDPDDPNTMTGNFSWTFTVSGALPIDIPFDEEDMVGDIDFVAVKQVD